MTRTIRIAAAAVLALTVGGTQAVVAYADQDPPPLPGAVIPSPVTTAQMLQIGEQYWAVNAPAGINPAPSCGQPHVLFASLAQWNAAGLTFFSAADLCGIEVDPTYTTAPYPPSIFCAIVVHELGHLVLGTMYFASNPGGPNHDDPSHSPDPTNVMFWQAGTTSTPDVCKALDPSAPSVSQVAVTTTEPPAARPSAHARARAHRPVARRLVRRHKPVRRVSHPRSRGVASGRG